MSTGTLAPAILAMRSRRAFMASVLPKMTASGGISPKGWIRALTGFEVLISIRGFVAQGVQSDVQSEHQTQGEEHYSYRSLAYLIDEKQLTKDCRTLQRVM